MKRISLSAKSAQHGVVIIEAMVAILLFSIGVLAVAGLQAAMVKNTSESKFRADASYIAQQVIGQLWVRPDALVNGATESAVAATLPNGEVWVTRAGDQYAVTVTWQQPGEPQHNFSTLATIAGNTSTAGI